MKHVSFANRNCSLARALDVVGEWWMLPILQEAFFGTRKFGDFQKHLGIAKNILADRLDRLVSNGLLIRDSQTPKGKGGEINSESSFFNNSAPICGPFP